MLIPQISPFNVINWMIYYYITGPIQTNRQTMYNNSKTNKQMHTGLQHIRLTRMLYLMWYIIS